MLQPEKTTNLKTIPLFYWGCQKTPPFRWVSFGQWVVVGNQKFGELSFHRRGAKAKGISWKVTEPIRQGRIVFGGDFFHQKKGGDVLN